MKVVKWVVIGLLVLIVAVGATFYAILRSLDTDELRGLIEAQAEKATGRKLRLEGPIDLSISLTPAVVLNDVRFDNADWGSRPELLDVGQVEAQVAILPLLEGRYVIERVVIKDADIILETNEAGEGNWSMAPADAGSGGAADGGEGAETPSGKPVIPEIGSIEIRDSGLVYRDGATGESLLLSLNALTLKPEGEMLALEAAGGYQEVPFEISGRIGGLPVIMGGGDLPVELAGTVADADFSVDGTIADLKGDATPDLRVELAAGSLSQFDKLAGTSLPDLGPLDLSGRIGLDAGVVTVDGLALALGQSDLAGNLTANLKGERPSLVGSLTGSKVDVSDFAGAAAAEETVSTAPGEQPAEPQGAGQQGDQTADRPADSRYVIPDTRLPLAALQAADAEIDLKLGQLIVDPKTTLTDLDLALNLENGRLEVSRFQAKAFEGAVDASLSLDAGASPPPLATRVDVKGVSVGQLMQAYVGSKELETSLDLAVDLKGRGASPRAIASSLNGRSEIVAGEGVITNQILAIVSSGLEEILGPLFGGQNETRLNCMVSRFRFEDGRAVSEAQLLDSSTFSLAGAGSIDLKDESLDLKFDTRTREAALVSLAIPFVVKGTLANPKPAPDALGTAMKAAEFVQAGSNPLAALGQVVSGDQAAASESNGCVAALEETAGVPASQTPIGNVQESLEKVLESDDAQKALDKAKDAIGEDAVKKGLEGVTKGLDGLFKRD